MGEGDVAQKGKLAMLHYTRRDDAAHARFDSSKLNHKSFSSLLGSERVTPGRDEGVRGMRVSGVRRLIVPPGLRSLSEVFRVCASLALGCSASRKPLNATLICEVEFLAAH